MRPGQVKPNEFELAILERLAGREPTIHAFVGQLHVRSREFTGVGSFTNFACEESSADAPDQRVDLDDLITMPGVPNGMGAVLFCKGGSPCYLLKPTALLPLGPMRDHGTGPEFLGEHSIVWHPNYALPPTAGPSPIGDSPRRTGVRRGLA